MTTAQQLTWARRMYILKHNSGSLVERDFYGKECIRLRAKLDRERTAQQVQHHSEVQNEEMEKCN